MQDLRPQYLNRSVLFMPVSNRRAVNKATTLPVDTVIIDLEDSVADGVKQQVESLLAMALSQEFGKRRCLVRINAFSSAYWQDDIAAVAQVMNNGLRCDGVVLPKVESVDEIAACKAAFDAADINIAIWIMVETATGIQRVDELCGFGDPVAGVMAGTADLALDLGLPDGRYRVSNTTTTDMPRVGLVLALSRVVLAARAAGIVVIDGVYPNYRDAEGFEFEARQGFQLGFDGKSLIHPNQLAVANQVFTPTTNEITEARALVSAWREAELAGHAVCSYKGAMVEELHVRQALKRIALYERASE